ncbi:MAG: epoxyqueuosine reductase QueH [Clostridiales bacterium]|jgi:predicted adenine nucleotide alpha hydrolase (AANH) superfamily ATPase|nr:epoxyqueuosine reductase QueH [Clostridiales bacterium]
MNKINYQKETDSVIESLNGTVPTLLLHSCCAPCSSYTLEYLSRYFSITVFYFNPNISPKAEFDKRFAEQKRLIETLPSENKISLICGDYNYDEFLNIARGYESVPEGGERCFRCYRMRLEKTAKLAKQNGFDYFCTTLSISPLKNSQKINEIGFDVAEKYGVKWLPSDFKKREGYKRSIELSREYDLYRQNFCGCVFSKSQN